MVVDKRAEPDLGGRKIGWSFLIYLKLCIIQGNEAPFTVYVPWFVTPGPSYLLILKNSL